jgi:hypothetical protein
MTIRLTERRNPATQRIDVAEPIEIVDLIAAEDATIPALVHGAARDRSRDRAGRTLVPRRGPTGLRRRGSAAGSVCRRLRMPTFGTAGDQIGMIAAAPRSSNLQKARKTT